MIYKIQIYIEDYSIREKNEKLREEAERKRDLGFQINDKDVENKIQWKLTNFYFNPAKLDSYWIDPDKDDRSGTFDIVFYISGNSFRTPYFIGTEELFNRILMNK